MRSIQPVSIRRKWNAVLTVFFFIIMFLPVSTYAVDTIVNYDYTQEITDLTKNYDSILDYTESKRCIAYSDQDKTLCSTYEDTVVYLYKTDTAAPPTVLNKNTEQLTPTTYKIYSSDVYYQDEQTNTWKQTEYGVIEKMDFQAVQDYELKTVDEISFFNNPFKIYRVNAQSPIFSNSDDGALYGSDATWSTARSKNTADGIMDTNAYWWSAYVEKYNGVYFIGRAFFRFDTSSLSGTVASSSLIITAQDNTDNNQTTSYYKLYGSNHSNPLVIEDFDLCNGNAVSDNKDLGDFVVNTPEKIEITDNDIINVDGNTDICMLIGWDIEDTSIESANDRDGIQQYYSEQTGTDYDPYLLVDIGEEATTTPEEEATTTLSELPELPFIDDLTVITGRTDHYESSTTAADWSELHYYRVPAFLWWILTSTFLFILGFILSQIQRILRKKNKTS